MQIAGAPEGWRMCPWVAGSGDLSCAPGDCDRVVCCHAIRAAAWLVCRWIRQPSDTSTTCGNGVDRPRTREGSRPRGGSWWFSSNGGFASAANRVNNSIPHCWSKRCLHSVNSCIVRHRNALRPKIASRRPPVLTFQFRTCLALTCPVRTRLGARGRRMICLTRHDTDRCHV